MACDSYGPYNLKLDGDNKTSLNHLLETLESAGFSEFPEFSFRWDGDKVISSSTFTPKAKGEFDGVTLYDKLTQRFTGYLSENDLGGSEAKNCLNNYSFNVIDNSRIYGTKMLSSMNSVSSPADLAVCSSNIDL